MTTLQFLRNSTLIIALLVSIQLVNAQDINYADSLNHDEVSDCMPFLTSNGLGIYFVSNRNGSDGSIFYSTRSSTTSYFNHPKLLGSQFDFNYYSPSLTQDELTIFVINQSTKKLNKASRVATTDSFGILSEVAIKTKLNIYGPAISPNGKELVISDEKNNLVFFKLNSSNTFIYNYTYKPKNKNHTFGFSKYADNGLKLYTTIEKGAANGEDDLAIVFSRASTALPFVAYKVLTTLSGQYITHYNCSATDNGKILAAVQSSNMWNGNNIYLFHIKPIK
jgi:hypothetical protein